MSDVPDHSDVDDEPGGEKVHESDLQHEQADVMTAAAADADADENAKVGATADADADVSAEGNEPAVEPAVSNVTALPSADRGAKLRIIEAALFASEKPLAQTALAAYLEPDDPVADLVEELRTHYAARGVNLVKVAGGWAFRTASDLSYLLERHITQQRRLSRAALETLAIIAYHQPVTRAEIEEIRGVSTSKGTIDVLLETEWIKLRGRRRAPGRPVTYGTTETFLDQFNLEGVGDLPGLAELKGAGLLQSNLPPDFEVPDPVANDELTDDEVGLDDVDDPEMFEDEPEEDDDDVIAPHASSNRSEDEIGDQADEA